MLKKSLHFSLTGSAVDRLAELQDDLGGMSPDQAISVALGIAAAVAEFIGPDGILTVIDPSSDISPEDRQVEVTVLPGRGNSPHRDAA
jgi:hypothetical protein